MPSLEDLRAQLDSALRPPGGAEPRDGAGRPLAHSSLRTGLPLGRESGGRALDPRDQERSRPASSRDLGQDPGQAPGRDAEAPSVDDLKAMIAEGRRATLEPATLEPAGRGPSLAELRAGLRAARAAPIPEPIGLPEALEPRSLGALRRGAGRLRQGVATGASELGLIAPEHAARMIGEAQLDIAESPPPEEVERGLLEIAEAQSLGEGLSAIARNPGAVASAFGESVPLFIPSMGLAAAGSAAGPIGTGVGAGAGSALVEYSVSLLDSLQRNGIDPFDDEAVAAALSDPDFLDEARERAATRGVVIGTFDALTGGLAGRLLAGAGGVGSTLARGAGEVALATTGGGAGEAVAQVATEGEVVSPGEVLLEAAVEIIPGAGEVALNLPALRADRQAQQQTPRQRQGPAPEAAGSVRAPGAPPSGTAAPAGQAAGRPAGAQPGDLARAFVARDIQARAGRQPATRPAQRGPAFDRAAAPLVETPAGVAPGPPEKPSGGAVAPGVQTGEGRPVIRARPPLDIVPVTGEMGPPKPIKLSSRPPRSQQQLANLLDRADKARNRPSATPEIRRTAKAIKDDTLERLQDLRDQIVAAGPAAADSGPIRFEMRTARGAETVFNIKADVDAIDGLMKRFGKKPLGSPSFAMPAEVGEGRSGQVADFAQGVDNQRTAAPGAAPPRGGVPHTSETLRGPDENLGRTALDSKLPGTDEIQALDLDEPGQSGNFSNRPNDVLRESRDRGFTPGERHKGFVRDVFDPTKEPLPKNVRPLVRQDIIAPLMKDLGVPLFQGRIKGKRRLGFFRPATEEVRVKRTADIEVTAHEIAHLLDKRFPQIRRQWKPGTKANAAFREELRAVSYDKTKLFEGFAEFVRLWATQREEAAARAPNFFEWWESFLDGNRHGPALRRAQDEMHAFFEQAALDRFASKVGQVADVNEGLQASFAERFRAGALDDVFGIGRAEKTLTGRYNGLWYIRARQTHRVSGIVQSALLYGAPSWTEGGVDSVDRNGKPIWVLDDNRQPVRNPDAQPWGLEQILAPVADNLKEAGFYFIARRAAFLKQQGRENLFTNAEIEAALALETPARLKAFEDWNRFNKQLLDFAEAAGVINPDTRAKWETDVYLPFWRVGNAAAGKTAFDSVPGARSIIKRLRGGTGNVGRPIENMHQNVRMLIESAIYNRTNLTVVKGILAQQGESPESPGGARFLAKIPATSKAVNARKQSIREALSAQFLRQLEEEGRAALRAGDEDPAAIAERLDAKASHFEETLDAIFDDLYGPGLEVWLDNQPAKGPNIIAVMEGGKARYYEVADSLLFHAMTSFPRRASANGFLQFMKLVRRVGQRTITWSVNFVARNIVRDQFMAAVMSENGYRFLIDAARGFKSRVRRDATYQAWLANGGSMASFWSSETAFENHLRSFYEERGIAYDFVINGPKKLAFFVDRWLDAFETATRLGEFKRALARGASLEEAAFQSAEVSTDFSMRGDPRITIAVPWDAAALGFLYDTVIFLKAGVVGVDRAYRGFTKQSDRGKVALATGAIALATLALYAFNRGNPLYDDLEDWDRDVNWHIIFPRAEYIAEWERTGRLPEGVPPEELYHHFRLPKPWEIGGIATITERAFEGILEQDPDQAAAILRVVREMFRYNLIPQVAQPPFEQWMNRQLFFDRPIVPPGLEDLPDFMQSTPRTSRTITAIAEATEGLPLEISPVRLEALLRGYFNAWAAYGLTLSDQIFFDDVPALRVDEYPGIGPFFRQQPAKSTRFQTEFYDMLKEATEARRGMREADRRYRPELAERLGQSFENQIYDQLTRTQRQAVQPIRAEMKLIINIPDLKTLHDYANGLGREFPSQIGKLRLSKSWNDLGLLKRDLLDMWRVEKNRVFKTVVQDVEAQRREAARR